MGPFFDHQSITPHPPFSCWHSGHMIVCPSASADRSRKEDQWNMGQVRGPGAMISLPSKWVICPLSLSESRISTARLWNQVTQYHRLCRGGAGCRIWHCVEHCPGDWSLLWNSIPIQRHTTEPCQNELSKRDNEKGRYPLPDLSWLCVKPFPASSWPPHSGY